MKPGVVIIAAALLAPWGGAAHADASAVHKEIQAEYVKYDKATLQGMAGLRTWCKATITSDFVVKPADGSAMTGKEFLKVLDAMIKHPDPNWEGMSEQKTTVTKLKMQGKDAVATITTVADMSITDAAGQYGAKDGKHKMTLIKSFRETWTKSLGRWKIRHSLELPGGSMLIDGKKVGAGAQ